MENKCSIFVLSPLEVAFPYKALQEKKASAIPVMNVSQPPHPQPPDGPAGV